MQKTYLKWFNKGDEDELSLKVLLREKDGHPNTVCFLCQQMTEKYLKGFLIFHQKSFPKVHDLLQLETLLAEIESNIKTLHKDLVFLNGFYIETRYPGDYHEFSWEDATNAFNAASHIKKFILQTTTGK